jgi:hypothetical protein
LEIVKVRGHLEALGVDGRIILEWILWKEGEGCKLDSSASGQGQVAGSCGHDNELSSSIKGGEFLEWLSDC